MGIFKSGFFRDLKILIPIPGISGFSEFFDLAINKHPEKIPANSDYPPLIRCNKNISIYHSPERLRPNIPVLYHLRKYYAKAPLIMPLFFIRYKNEIIISNLLNFILPDDIANLTGNQNSESRNLQQ